jgi:hypothetical protein
MISSKWPYGLPANARYNLHPLPIDSLEEKLDLFFKYKRESEDVYIGNISKHDNVVFEGSGWVNDQFSTYFKDQLFHHPAKSSSNLSIKLFPKMCWLAHAYYRDGFKFPVCIHYNPRIQKNVMHPGATRNHIINLFHQPTDFSCLYYNTNGVQFDFMQRMKKMSRLDLEAYPNLHLNLVMDHCSMIPHINLDNQSVTDNIPLWQDTICKRLIDPHFKINMNHRIESLARWETTNSAAPVKIYISDPKNKDDIVRACILAVIGKSYSSDTLTVIA